MSELLSYASDTIIITNINKQNHVNKNLFGSNLVGYDPATWQDWTNEFYGFSDFGAGIWDPEIRLPISKAVNLAKDAGITVLRFPGGCGVHHYNWKHSINPNRENFLFGLDEFLKVCHDVKAEPVITLSYFTGNEQDAADMVEYLNSPADEKHPWALKRSNNGHHEPYNVKYFEIGNEDYHGNHRNIKYVKPRDYAKRYLKYYQAIKKTDSSVQVGVILHTPEWNQIVAEIIMDNADFGIIHTYPTPSWGKKLETIPPEEIFTISLRLPITSLKEAIININTLFNKVAGKNLPLAVTEYNGGYVQEHPLPYRHTLGCALVNAELIRMFMEPENNIIMANNWNFCNEYWGMIANGFNDNPNDLYNPFYKRPNYYVFEMYNRHFGDILLNTKTDSEYLSCHSSIDRDNKKIFLMVLNKNFNNSIKAIIKIQNFLHEQKANAWILNGPDITSTNEENHDNVSIKHQTIDTLSNQDFNYTFEPHSITSLELKI